MHRFKFKSLIKWKLYDKRKPLILLGARQVGKTWLVQEFGNTEYRQVAYINFEHPNTPKALFETDF
jgi:predicted AAA+ superfamily ATPase